MSEYLDNVGVEEQEVAETAEVATGAEEQEVAAPVDKSDAAFAEMRREIERLQLDNARKDKALGFYFDGDNKEVKAIAHAMGQNPEDVQKALDTDAELLQLKQTLQSERAERAMEKDLAEIQKLDPNVKSLDDLGETYANYIRAGLSGVDAYAAIKAKENLDTETPPKTIGNITPGQVKKDYFTSEEVDRMSPSEQLANHDAIMSSMAKW
jgi:hypothetical protein